MAAAPVAGVEAEVPAGVDEVPGVVDVDVEVVPPDVAVAVAVAEGVAGVESGSANVCSVSWCHVLSGMDAFLLNSLTSITQHACIFISRLRSLGVPHKHIHCQCASIRTTATDERRSQPSHAYFEDM